MFMKKLTKEEREILRAQRRETQLIREKAREKRFEYVVNPPEIPRVAFGTSLERETLPLRGQNLSPFMRKCLGDLFLSPGPQANVDERNFFKLNWPSKFGHSSFVSKIPRIVGQQVSSGSHVGYHDVIYSNPVKKARIPFNVGAKRKDHERYLTPAPPTYPYHVQRPKPKISSGFGSKRKIIPAIKVICSPKNSATCQKCEQTPIGDYWHDFSTNLDLCRICMNKMWAKLKGCEASDFERLRIRREYHNYQMVRYCDFYHDHGGTAAAVQMLPTRIFKLKIKKENYLSLYM